MPISKNREQKLISSPAYFSIFFFENILSLIFYHTLNKMSTVNNGLITTLEFLCIIPYIRDCIKY